MILNINHFNVERTKENCGLAVNGYQQQTGYPHSYK